MKKIKLKESDLIRLIKRLVKEEVTNDTPNYDDYVYACSVAKEIEQWWKDGQEKGDESEMGKFFLGFNNFWDDDDEGASISYNKLLNTYRTKMAKILTKGVENDYYKAIDAWFNKIVDNINSTFQDNCRLELVSPDNQDIKYFDVDPEID